MERRYSISEVAEILKVSVSAMKLWSKNGKFKEDDRICGRERFYYKDTILKFARENNYQVDEFDFMSREELLREVRRRG